jgi:23S rRNA (uracil1939-C5)-methyltransferase
MVPGLAAIWHRPRPGQEAVLLAGEPYVEELWRGERVPLRAGMFLQVNRGAAAALEDHVLGLAAAGPIGRAVDAYAGVGTMARALAAAGAKVTAIETDGDAVAVGASLGDGIEWIHGRVEDRIAAELPVDLVIVNPPRSGLDAAVCRALVERPPHRVVYVSCDPATLARDLRRVEPALRLRTTRCFDLFPQTSHIETVAELECATT